MPHIFNQKYRNRRISMSFEGVSIVNLHLDGVDTDLAQLAHTELTHLCIVGPGKIMSLNALPSSLLGLTLWRVCIKDYTELSHLENLVSLAHGYGDLTRTTGIDRFTNLRALELIEFEQLYDIKPIESLAQIEWLKISDCAHVTELPDLEAMLSLQRIVIDSCPCLTTFLVLLEHVVCGI